MRLSFKVIIIVVSLVSLLISTLFVGLIIRVNRQSEENILSSARSIYRNILIVRKWISDQDGVLVKKQAGMEPNPFLEHPELFTDTGDTLLVKNPALVTREMSVLSNYIGEDFSFHLASKRYINPLNKPDEFELEALDLFEDSTGTDRPGEYYRVEQKGDKLYFRYFAPLYTRESCLSCHATQGYEVGDIRGGISVLLSVDSYLQDRRSNVIYLVSLAILSIIILSLLIYYSLQRSIIVPLRLIESKANDIKNGIYDTELDIPNKDEIGSLAKAFTTMGNQIRRYMNQLRTSEQKNRSIIENSPESVAIINSSGQILEFNQNLVRFTGFSSDELSKKNFYSFVDMKNLRKINSHQIHTEAIGSTAEHFETVLRTKDEIEVPVELYITPGTPADNHQDQSFVYLRDISERKQLEKYSIQAEKMFALGKLSSGIAHEIRNPLFALNNNINFLHEKKGDAAQFRAIYPELKDSIDRIQKIVSSILDYSRPHQPSFKQIDINQVIEQSLTLIEKQLEKSRIDIVITTEKDDRLIEADEHRLVQIFVNLILNAIQAMGDVGKLTIDTHYQTKHLRVRIADTGTGISKQDLDRIFDPFFTKSQGGTGLGLTVTQRILDDHNARYTVESVENMGTTFSIYFPYVQG